jgi:hypothetical protein
MNLEFFDVKQSSLENSMKYHKNKLERPWC